MSDLAFNDFCRRERCSYVERDALAYHLAQARARKLYKQLRPSPYLAACEGKEFAGLVSDEKLRLLDQAYMNIAQFDGDVDD